MAQTFHSDENYDILENGEWVDKDDFDPFVVSDQNTQYDCNGVMIRDTSDIGLVEELKADGLLDLSAEDLWSWVQSLTGNDDAFPKCLRNQLLKILKDRHSGFLNAQYASLFDEEKTTGVGKEVAKPNNKTCAYNSAKGPKGTTKTTKGSGASTGYYMGSGYKNYDNRDSAHSYKCKREEILFW